MVWLRGMDSKRCDQDGIGNDDGIGSHAGKRGSAGLAPETDKQGCCLFSRPDATRPLGQDELNGIPNHTRQ